jgi:hypothetical protein
MMNIRRSKQVESKKNWIKTLIWKSAFFWLKLHEVYSVNLQDVKHVAKGVL